MLHQIEIGDQNTDTDTESDTIDEFEDIDLYGTALTVDHDSSRF